MINPRKLAAIDIVFLGPKMVIAEFAGGALLSSVLGTFVLLRGHGSLLQILLGVYFLALGVNYVPMLVFALTLQSVSHARTELGSELEQKRDAMAKYRRQSLWLLVPLVVPIVTISRRERF